jgi:hypothetical protein
MKLNNVPIDLFLDLEVDLSIHELAYDMAYEENKEERLKIYKEYDKCTRLLKIGKSQIEHGLKNWDWRSSVEKGLLCINDLDIFKEELEEAGINCEEWKKKYRRIKEQAWEQIV